MAAVRGASLLWCLLFLAREPGNPLWAAAAAKSGKETTTSEAIAEKESELEGIVEGLRQVITDSEGSHHSTKRVKEIVDHMDEALAKARKLEDKARLELIQATLDKRDDFVQALNSMQEL
eukprot:CAMPEP_0171197420 /NCGR_PEP_ID=MMETSP0790-20130122/22404_1 /TAXON_ID=2925 /ORGANISM="Alexandrium catenella, Strain OF101" /LENGTH=119 /DNA_ID=CAMNT_0011662665 /DNA_START=36 /DNA_END=395 /DNA_ORIENTATION=+